MNDPIQKCPACGSSRVVAGQLGQLSEAIATISEEPAAFLFSELKEQPGYWTSFSISEPLPRTVSIRHHGNASACLDCGAVSAPLFLNIKDAKRVLEKYGTDEVKMRLATTPPAP